MHLITILIYTNKVNNKYNSNRISLIVDIYYFNVYASNILYYNVIIVVKYII